jgi:NAD(P)-dependent dehydrogenase (short-subunit alcohol dehydrogenase family)
MKQHGFFDENDRLKELSKLGGPLGRHGRPDEVGDLIAFLVSDKASFITGVNIQIDDGSTAGLTLPQLDY